MEADEVELKWKEYIDYIDRCKSRKWLPAKPSQEFLDMFKDRLEDSNNANSGKKKK